MALKILGYGCTSAAGPSTSDFWNGLCEGIDHSISRVCLWKETKAPTSFKNSAAQELVFQLQMAWTQTLNGLTPERRQRVRDDRNLGVIFASTKGALEDFVWESAFSEMTSDPLTPVLEEFLRATEITTENYLCVSNACTSAVAALFLAQQWIKQKRVDHVLVITADKIGPFVTQGFSALKALTTKKAKPFAQDRDGLQLGEGACAFLLARGDVDSREKSSDLFLTGIAIDTEGFAVTRPSSSGESLRKVIESACNTALDRTAPPDLIVAHGTGTQANDKTEDQVISELFGEKVPVTATKWSIGHTLGSSAAMDLIAALESIKNQRVFHIGNTGLIDSEFKGRYLIGKPTSTRGPIKKILSTSLGFGGVHGALVVEGVES